MMTLDPPNHTKELLATRVLDTELGTIYFYDNVIVMEGKESVTFSIRTGIFTLLKIVKIVGTKPVVYISNRINSYSVDPNDYKYLEMIPNLKGIAIVSYNEFAGKTAEMEKHLKPSGILSTLKVGHRILLPALLLYKRKII